MRGSSASLIAIVAVWGAALSGLAPDALDAEIAALLAKPAKYASVPEPLFASLGWNLPDEGVAVKRIAAAASRGAFDPRALEQLPSSVGYRARWYVERFSHYNLPWDITALHLVPNRPVPGLPTVAIVNGGSANWYEFFVDPLNGPGIGQYLAQRVPVILISIPGNYRDGGWSEPYDRRRPEYVLGASLPDDELKLRNALYTFSMIGDGITALLEKHTSGPLLIVGHSTGGEFQFMLNTSSLAPRLRGLSLGWGTGPPAHVKKAYDEHQSARADRVESMGKGSVWDLRGRNPEGYVSSGYIGPLNPVPGDTRIAVARGWFEREFARRPHFKQIIQDIEHQGVVEHRQKYEREIRQILEDNRYGIDAESVLAELFAPSRSSLTGYRKIAWVVGRLDGGHWSERSDDALEMYSAERFREANPGASIRVLLLDAPVSHYGHIERPQQLAGALYAAAKWLMSES